MALFAARRKKIMTAIRSGSWFGKDEIKRQGRVLKDSFESLKQLSQKKSAGPKESFAQAMTRLKLTESDLTAWRKKYVQAALLYLAFAVVTLGYDVYLWMSGRWLGGLEAFLLGAMLLMFAMREHVMAFKIKKRSFAFGFKTWFWALVKGDRV